jgi:hypothetical protein
MIATNGSATPPSSILQIPNRKCRDQEKGAPTSAVAGIVVVAGLLDELVPVRLYDLLSLRRQGLRPMRHGHRKSVDGSFEREIRSD